MVLCAIKKYISMPIFNKLQTERQTKQEESIRRQLCHASVFWFLIALILALIFTLDYYPLTQIINNCTG
jgi:hypothetical protein